MNLPTSLADALFTTTQQRMLALLFGQPSRSFFATELIELTGSGSGAVQREFKRLASSGLVNVTRIGKQKHYQANPESPVFDELHGLVLKTVAMVQPIRQALEPLADRVVLALVYGSVAKGADTAASDIDSAHRRRPGDPGGHLLDPDACRSESGPQDQFHLVHITGICRQESRRQRFLDRGARRRACGFDREQR